jgi:hypothetical protein
VVSSSASSSQQPNKILGEERRDEEMGDEAMLSFIRSFQNETLAGQDANEADAATETANKQGGVDGVAMPGAYVQFFVAPLTPLGEEKAVLHKVQSADTGADKAWSIALGAQTGYDGSPPILDDSVDTDSSAVALLHNHFGAVSNHGIFLSAVARSSSDRSGAPAARTKLDAPNAYVWGSMHPR